MFLHHQTLATRSQSFTAKIRPYLRNLQLSPKQSLDKEHPLRRSSSVSHAENDDLFLDDDDELVGSATPPITPMIRSSKHLFRVIEKAGPSASSSCSSTRSRSPSITRAAVSACGRNEEQGLASPAFLQQGLVVDDFGASFDEDEDEDDEKCWMPVEPPRLIRENTYSTFFRMHSRSSMSSHSQLSSSRLQSLQTSESSHPSLDNAPPANVAEMKCVSGELKSAHVPLIHIGHDYDGDYDFSTLQFSSRSTLQAASEQIYSFRLEEIDETIETIESACGPQAPRHQVMERPLIEDEDEPDETKSQPGAQFSVNRDELPRG